MEARRYDDAIQVQDACNLSGVVFAFARIMQEMCDEGLDTDARNKHPISVMFADKIRDLTQCDATLAFSRAYDACKDKVED